MKLSFLTYNHGTLCKVIWRIWWTSWPQWWGLTHQSFRVLRQRRLHSSHLLKVLSCSLKTTLSHQAATLMPKEQSLPKRLILRVSIFLITPKSQSIQSKTLRLNCMLIISKWSRPLRTWRIKNCQSKITLRFWKSKTTKLKNNWNSKRSSREEPQAKSPLIKLSKLLNSQTQSAKRLSTWLRSTMLSRIAWLSSKRVLKTTKSQSKNTCKTSDSWVLSNVSSFTNW